MGLGHHGTHGALPQLRHYPQSAQNKPRQALLAIAASCTPLLLLLLLPLWLRLLLTATADAAESQL